MIVVQKYGGSSVATIDKIKNIAKYLVNKKKKENIDLVVVVSAMGKMTDNLIDMSKEITIKPNLREMDRLLSIGEQQTIALLTMAIQELGMEAISLTGEQASIKTIGMHTKSNIKDIDNANILKYTEKGYIVVIAGFQGINELNEITTLGRGGSDTTAVALSIILDAKCEIYTDVDGIYCIDPRIYKKAKKIDKISYEEMMELSFKGANIMETRAVELGKKYDKEIYVAKTLSDIKGTYITKKENMETKIIKGISINKDLLHITIENIPTYAKNIYPIFEKANSLGITVDMISQNDVLSENGSFAFTTNKNEITQINKLTHFLKEMNENIKIIINDKKAKITVVGIGLMSDLYVISKIFKILSDNNISFHQVATSEISISFVIDEEVINKLSNLLAEEFNF